MLKQREVIKNAVLEAGKIILEAKPTEVVHQKAGMLNFVTQADLQSEEAIINLIQESFPSHLILSEETHQDISNPLDTENLWVIDPMDGTVNFKFEQNYSCVSIAYVERGIIQLGAIYNPFRDELFYAEKMQGAFLNGKKISVGSLNDISKARIASDDAYDPMDTRHNIELFLKLKPTPWFLIKGSAALTMCEVSCERMDLYYQTRLKPWDNAAAFLILEESGATIKDTKGKDTNFLTEDVVCGNEHLVKQFVQALL
jgi:myo-inositol-1(or 4)-monophosphatase